jgi:hypothetical protein
MIQKWLFPRLVNVGKKEVPFIKCGVKYVMIRDQCGLWCEVKVGARHHDPSLGLATKTTSCEVAGQEGSLGVMPHAPRSARKCEGIDLHILKGTPTLGVWSPNGLTNFQSEIAEAKTQWFEDFFTSLENYSNVDVQNGLV